MGRHKGNPTPWQLLTEAALAYADAESASEVSRSEDRLRYAACAYWGDVAENCSPKAPRGRSRRMTDPASPEYVAKVLAPVRAKLEGLR